MAGLRSSGSIANNYLPFNLVVIFTEEILKNSVLLICIASVIAGCKSTSSGKLTQQKEAARKFQQQMLLPELQKKDLQRYVSLFGLSSCSELLLEAAKINVTPTSIEGKKVTIVAHTGEKMTFKYPKSCPKQT
ncbi:hypothetical protein [Planctobacterium marinum]|uniref:Uncharacterized protein n=1 Tax=Planctobacterium marinum TaxID=1631968 RepID=A0AA48HMH3_9ALTE|nr:hypothetical protein MACH26_30320 [Planctobacterium marinum]